jgi:glycosyltransferase involved in cell wall biosynthesis
MEDVDIPRVSILIPHFRTLELTQFCLRSLRKYTDPSRVQIIVIDNGSRDASTEYLRGLSWITLIERDPVPGESGATAHARALDLGLTRARAPFILSMHTDTIVISPRWLDFLLGHIEADERIAGIGSWKLEFKPWHKRFAKRLEAVWLAMRTRLPRCLRKQGIRKTDNHYFYLRSHCALYRTELVRRFGLRFDDENETAGKALHRKLEEQGFTLTFLDSYGLTRHVRHVNHATMILNPELAGRKTGTEAERRRLRRELERLGFEEFLKDESLDRA